MEKVCSTCNIQKSLEDFARDNRLKSGRTAQCKSCRQARSRKTALKNQQIYNPDAIKQCNKCRELKPHKEFHKLAYGRGGVRGTCKPCQLELAHVRREFHKENNTPQYRRKLELARQHSKKRREENPEYMRDYRYKSKYNMTYEEYLSLLQTQQGQCRICGLSSEKAGGMGNKLVVDHCHGTEVVRGLLCTQCNTGLGYFKDNIDNLFSAIKYLQDFKNET